MLAGCGALTIALSRPPVAHPRGEPPRALLWAPVQPERAATWAWFSLGRQWVVDGRLNPDDAVATVRGIGDADPAWQLPWVLAPLMLQAQGASGVAEPLLIAATERFEDPRWFYAALGVHAADAGELDAARTWLDRARTSPP